MASLSNSQTLPLLAPELSLHFLSDEIPEETSLSWVLLSISSDNQGKDTTVSLEILHSTQNSYNPIHSCASAYTLPSVYMFSCSPAAGLSVFLYSIQHQALSYPTCYPTCYLKLPTPNLPNHMLYFIFHPNLFAVMLIFHPLPMFGKYGFLSVLNFKMRIKPKKLVGTWEMSDACKRGAVKSHICPLLQFSLKGHIQQSFWSALCY